VTFFSSLKWITLGLPVFVTLVSMTLILSGESRCG
jgi:hypothetical protein